MDTPILKFVNKLDREGIETLDILADIEETLQVECAPLTWPIGMEKCSAERTTSTARS